LDIKGLVPILSNNGRGTFRNAAKGFLPVISRDQAEPGTILEYRNESGVSEYGQVAMVGEIKTGGEDVTINAISAEQAAKLVKNNPALKQVTLTQANTIPMPASMLVTHKKDFVDIIFSPIDWFIMLFSKGPLEKVSDNLSSKQALSGYLIFAIILVIAFMAYGFYLVAKAL